MDLRLTADEEAFRSRFRHWLDHVRPPDGLRDWGLTATLADVEPGRAWHRMLGEGGWSAPAWPREHGGLAATPVMEAVMAEELATRQLPRQLTLAAIELVGPLVIAFGTARQRALLEPMRTGEHVWCQLLSEPDAGSDLAAIATRAVRSDGGWTVTGQKVWTSGAHYADRAMLLARTEPDAPARDGLTMFILPMDRAGIVVRPIVQIDRGQKFNEVFLDGLRVGPEDVLGPVNGGWRVLGSVMGRERLSFGAQAIELLRALDEIAAAKSCGGFHDGAVFRDRWSGCWARAWLLRVTMLRLLSGTDGFSDPRMSMLKLIASELQQDVALLAGDAVGVSATCTADHRGCGDRILATRGATIAGGTSEILRDVLAERVLGLPREPR